MSDSTITLLIVIGVGIIIELACIAAILGDLLKTIRIIEGRHDH